LKKKGYPLFMGANENWTSKIVKGLSDFGFKIIKDK